MKAKDAALCGMGAALLCVCAWISIPAAVPFTLQTLGVFLVVGLLGGRRGSITVLVYLLLGAVGLPVFSGFNGGLGALLGPTGGYIVGFLACALAMWGITARFGEGEKVLALAMLLGLLVCCAIGTAWYMLVFLQRGEAQSLSKVLTVCVFPFLLPDGVKGALSLLLIERLKPYLQRENSF